MRRPRLPSARASSSPLRRGVLLTLALVLAVLTGAGGSTPARADEPSPVRVELTSLEPAVLTTDGTVRISGTITNTTDEIITSPQVLLWRDLSPMTTADQVGAALSSPPTMPIGARVVDVPTAYTQNLPDEFAPRASLAFTVSAPASALGLPSGNAVYLIGVHARGYYQGTNQTVGRGRTFVAYDESDVGRVDVTDVVLLSSRPSLSNGLFTDDHLAGEIRPGGRLDVLLRTAGTSGISVAIDPATLDEITVMSGPYRVLRGDEVVDGTDQEAAKSWLSRWDELDSDEWRLPWASPDLAALAHRSAPDLAEHPARATKNDQRTQDLPVLVAPVDGQVDAATLALAEEFDPSAVLVSGLRVPVGRGADDTPLVNIAPDAFVGGPAPDPSTTAVQVRQRILADTMIAALAGDRTPVVRVIDSQSRAQAITDAPHVRRRTLSQLIDSTSARPQVPGYPERARAGELTDLQVTEAESLAAAYEASADLQGDSEAVRRAADLAVGRAVSSWWRGAEKRSRSWVRDESDVLAAQLAGSDVRIVAPETIYMGGRDGQFPISITNKLEVPVKVAIRFTADNPQRLQIPRIKDLTVGPGESVTVNARPHASSNGTYRVRAQLTTSGGISIGRAASITVQATNIGKAGWIIVIGSGIVLLGGTVLRIRQVRRYGKGTT